ncbi:hypothetical protein RHGRI_005379 [Rhododendron griersonianum]|uniref:Hemoglobin n=1 Tax=Rhododendron griersonianum TaxID=479676 RepID=A0AAV6LCD2_9ERIC|nr:hypothetical protein RHGRI_005379 [Rhododendron griersonianum]
MQSLQQKASEWSGVEQSDAFAIDSINLFDKLGGLQTFVNLSTNFYNRYQGIVSEWRSGFMTMMKSGFGQFLLIQRKKRRFRINMSSLCKGWEGRPFTHKERTAAWYVCCRLEYESNIKKYLRHPALIGRHRPFPVSHQAAERWLHHMQQALDGMSDIDADSKIKMMNFFRHTAFFLVAGDELKKQNKEVPCKHGTSKPAAV